MNFYKEIAAAVFFKGLVFNWLWVWSLLNPVWLFTGCVRNLGRSPTSWPSRTVHFPLLAGWQSTEVEFVLPIQPSRVRFPWLMSKLNKIWKSFFHVCSAIKKVPCEGASLGNDEWAFLKSSLLSGSVQAACFRRRIRFHPVPQHPLNGFHRNRYLVESGEISGGSLTLLTCFIRQRTWPWTSPSPTTWLLWMSM